MFLQMFMKEQWSLMFSLSMSTSVAQSVEVCWFILLLTWKVFAKKKQPKQPKHPTLPVQKQPILISPSSISNDNSLSSQSTYPTASLSISSTSCQFTAPPLESSSSSSQTSSHSNSSNQLLEQIEVRIQQLASTQVMVTSILTTNSQWENLSAILDPPFSFWRKFGSHPLVDIPPRHLERHEEVAKHDHKFSPSNAIIQEWQHTFNATASNLLTIMKDIGCASAAKLIMEWTD